MTLAETYSQHLEFRSSRDQLIEEYLPYVKRIVHRIAIHLPPHIETEDLINAGIIGLIQAIERYDPSRENKFLTYAVFRIRGAVLSELRSRDYLSRSNRKKTRDLENVSLALEQKLGREVSEKEVADEMGIDLDEYYRIRAVAGLSFVSMEDLGSEEGGDEENLLSHIGDGLASDALTLTRLKEIQSALADAIEKLPENEKMVISLYYYEELTMKEIGSVLEVTESRVSQIHSRAVIRLRSLMKKAGLIDS